MQPDEVRKFVDQLHADKRISKEEIISIIEQAMAAAASKNAGGNADIAVHIDRNSFAISVYRDNVPLSTAEISKRIGAQSARQMITQKLREAEKNMVYDEFHSLLNEIVTGRVNRVGRNTIVLLKNDEVEALLPAQEQVPGEQLRLDGRISAMVVEVDKNGNGSKIRIVLSRSRPDYVRRLFEREVPEIADGMIEIKEISREPGHRTKVAVYSREPRIDLVGSCVGQRGARIRAIRDELSGGEQIDVIPWSDSPEEFIKNALQPAVVDEVILCSILGRAIVLVQEGQRKIAIGQRGQNVRLASRLCGWDIDIFTHEDLQSNLERAVAEFGSIDGVSGDLADHLVAEGFLTYDDLSLIEPDVLMDFGQLSQEEADAIIDEAEKRAELRTACSSAEKAADAAKRAEEAVGRAVKVYAERPDRLQEAVMREVRQARAAAADARAAREEAEKSVEIVGCDESRKALEDAKASEAVAKRFSQQADEIADRLRREEGDRGGFGGRKGNVGGRRNAGGYDRD